jgi:ATP-dependent Clp protease ATP-binding subunit ClpA
MFELFTEAARTAVMEAQAEATERADTYLGTEHLLVGLLREGNDTAAVVLAERSVTLDDVRAAIDDLVGPRTTVPPQEALASIGIDLGQVQARLAATFGPEALAPPPTPFDASARECLQAAVDEASAMHQPYVGTEHELLGLLQVTDGLGAKILQRLGVDLVVLSEQVRGRAASEA